MTAAARKGWMVSDAGQHLVTAAKLAFETIEDPDDAMETAIAVIRVMLDHVSPVKRHRAGIVLMSKALS